MQIDFPDTTGEPQSFWTHAVDCSIVYTCVRIGDLIMGTLKVGIREFREKLATYLLETDETVAITRHGDTVGYYIPARSERAALKEAAP